MSDPGPLGNPFEGMPFFGDLARMLGQQGAGAWDSARQLAASLATGGEPEANVDPVDRISIEQLARVADLRVTDVTGLSTSVSGRAVSVRPVNRTGWVVESLSAYRPLMEHLAQSLGPSEGASEPRADAGDDALAGVFSGMLEVLRPMMLAMTAGSMVGHLAERALGQYDLPIPRPATGTAADELLLVVPNLDAFAEEWSLAREDVRLWVCVREVATHAVFAVPHVRARMDELLTRHVSGFRNDASAFEDRIGQIDLSTPSALEDLQAILGSPEAILGAITSRDQEEIGPLLSALVATVAGVVDHVVDRVGGDLIPSHHRLTEAMRRRRVEASEADRFVERLFGLELSQATYDRGSDFVRGVVERAGEDGLRRLWVDAAHLPTPSEVDAPGLWLARIDL